MSSTWTLGAPASRRTRGAVSSPGAQVLALSWEPMATPQPQGAASPATLCHAMLCCAVLTEPHTGHDGDEGHDATEDAVDGEQRLVEVAGGRVRVVLVEEGEGGGGEGVEGGRGQQHSQVPALVLRGARQPVGQRVRDGSGPAPARCPALTSSCSRCARRR